MQRLLILLVALLATLPLPLSASQATNYAAGLKKANNRSPLVVFCYGKNYDKINPEIYEKLFKGKDRTFLNVIRRYNYVVVPVFQMPNTNEKREMQKVMGSQRLPGGIRTYPCIILVDENNQYRGGIQDAEDIEDPQKAAVALTKLMDDFKEQQDLLEKASRAKGSRHEGLMRDALSISSINVPRHGTYDPSTGGLVEQLQVIEDIPTANSHVRSFISGKPYTCVERQMMLVALAGHVRRMDMKNHKKVVHTNYLRALFTEIRNIDPESVYGKYAEGAIQIWVAPYEATKEEKSSTTQGKEEKPSADKAPAAK